MRVVFKTLQYGENKNNVLAVLLDTLDEGNLEYRGLFGEAGNVSKEYIRRQSRSAKPNEIVALKSELERTGIKLIVEKSL